ncbi:MAG: hypothetical protein SFT91_06465 [Rickettsiaceae bacterium]|nr:hypothetical protein [Rickettsiaceae bacterium]
MSTFIRSALENERHEMPEIAPLVAPIQIVGANNNYLDSGAESDDISEDLGFPDDDSDDIEFLGHNYYPRGE